MAVKGRRQLDRRLRVMGRNVFAEVRQALDDAADDLLARAQGLAPQLSGAMIGSGSIAGRQSRTLVSRTIFFESDYAVVRHEDFYNLGPISSVKTSPEGPIGRKYLQRPFEKHRERYQKEIQSAIDRGLRLSAR